MEFHCLHYLPLVVCEMQSWVIKQLKKKLIKVSDEVQKADKTALQKQSGGSPNVNDELVTRHTTKNRDRQKTTKLKKYRVKSTT